MLVGGQSVRSCLDVKSKGYESRTFVTVTQTKLFLHTANEAYDATGRFMKTADSVFGGSLQEPAITRYRLAARCLSATQTTLEGPMQQHPEPAASSKDRQRMSRMMRCVGIDNQMCWGSERASNVPSC